MEDSILKDTFSVYWAESILIQKEILPHILPLHLTKKETIWPDFCAKLFSGTKVPDPPYISLSDDKEEVKMLDVSYKYLRDEKGGLLATICHVNSRTSGDKCTGIAIVGDHDQFDRAEGKRVARTRAFEALLSKKTSGYICRKDRANVRKALNHQQIVLPYKSIYQRGSIN